MLDVLRLPVTQDHLLKMTKEERALFLVLGHAANQVNALWKLVIILTNGTDDDPVKQIGAMREALKLVEKRFVQSPLGREFLSLLDPQASEALGRLKKRFGKLDMFVVIRDSYAFHHPTIDEMEEAFQRANKSEYSEEADWAVYFNKALLNTFFFVSDFVFVHGMANALGKRISTRDFGR